MCIYIYIYMYMYTYICVYILPYVDIVYLYDTYIYGYVYMIYRFACLGPGFSSISQGSKIDISFDLATEAETVVHWTCLTSQTFFRALSRGRGPSDRPQERGSNQHQNQDPAGFLQRIISETTLLCKRLMSPWLRFLWMFCE